MPTFIKTGYWDKLSRAPKGYLDLDLLLSTVLPSQLGNNGKYLKTDGFVASWQSIPLSGYVPYTGATANLNLGLFNLTASSIIKNGGTSSQFLKADGSVDSSVYYLASNPSGYTNNLGTVTSIATTGPITGGTITGSGTIGITQASSSVDGYLSAADWNAFNGKENSLISFNRQTASYSLLLADRSKLVEMNVATANNLTVPLDSSIAFPIGTKIDIAQYGAGQTTVVATGGVTIRSALGALKLAAQYSGASLVKIATDEWYLFGDITV